MKQAVLGIDVSKDSLDVCLVQNNQNQNGIFGNNPKGHRRLISWLRKRCDQGQVHTCMEATGMYAFPVAEALFEAEFKVSVVNPARISAYAKSLLTRNKTDRLDAVIIADFCRTQSPPAWYPPRGELRELQALVRLLEDFKTSHQAYINRLNSGVRSMTVAQHLDTQIRFLEDQIRQLEEEIDTLVSQDADLCRKRERLVSIDGVGKKTAHVILGEILYLDSFENAKQLVAFAGLNPKQRISGKMKGRSPISKTGNAHLRKALYFPAIVAKKRNPVISQFCSRLEENDLVPMEIIVAAMRKLLHIAFGVLKNDCPFDPDYERRFNQFHHFQSFSS